VNCLQQVAERSRMARGDLVQQPQHRDGVALVVGLAGQLSEPQKAHRRA
jgi:hypothetical protein